MIFVVKGFFLFTETCPLPEIPNGKWSLTIDVTPLRRIHIASYRCDEGYLLVADEEERRCSPEGIFDSKNNYIEPNEWSGKEPECLKIGNNNGCV